MYTLVYDGECDVCGRIVNVVRNWDRGAIEIIPSQAPGVRARFPWITDTAYRESLQLIGPDGRIRHHWARVANAAQHPDKVLAALREGV